MKILLIDSSGILHRHFHAAEPRHGTTAEGHAVDTGAVHGYLQYLNKRVYGPRSDLDFDVVIHALDDGGSDFRRALYPAYKAQRSTKSPALIAQEAMLGQALRALGERTASKRGVEADDILATLAHQFAEAGHIVAVVTSDKDLFQLVRDEHVIVIRDTKGANGYNQHTFYDSKCVSEKMGVAPSQIADWLALTGDTSDNIPGVQGVGPKTAGKWLAEFGSLAALLTHADTIKGRYGDRLRAARDDGSLAICRQLTTARDDIEGVDGAGLLAEPAVDTDQARAITRMLALADGWLPRPRGEAGENAAVPPGDSAGVRGEAGFGDLLQDDAWGNRFPDASGKSAVAAVTDEFGGEDGFSEGATRGPANGVAASAVARAMDESGGAGSASESNARGTVNGAGVRRFGKR